jgi:DNA-binding MarR family transcriptional regulator
LKNLKNQRNAGFLISQIKQLSGRIFSKKLKEFEINDLNPGQGRIMFALWKGDGISLKELADRTSLGKSTLSMMLDRLEKAGKIKRMQNKDNRREIRIELANLESQNLKEKYLQVSEEMNSLFYKNFSEIEKDRFEEFLVRILENLKKDLQIYS